MVKYIIEEENIGKEKIKVWETEEILGLSKKQFTQKLKLGHITRDKINTEYGQKWVIDKERTGGPGKKREERRK